MLVKRINPQALIPSKGTIGSIGFDVASTTTTTIQPGKTVPIPTGLATAFTSDMYLRIATRSSMAMKQLIVQGGVVDSDYRGEIQVLLHNQSTTPITIPAYTKIAQFIFEKAEIPLLQVTTQLPQSSRANNGFGSTNNTSPSVHKRITTFRINENDVILFDKSKRHHKARRVAMPIQLPIIHQNDKRYWNHPDKAVIDKRRIDINCINIYNMSENQLTQVDPILKMSINTTAVNTSPSVIPPTDEPTSAPPPSTPLQSSFLQRWQSTPTYTTTPTIPPTATIPSTLPSHQTSFNVGTIPTMQT